MTVAPRREPPEVKPRVNHNWHQYLFVNAWARALPEAVQSEIIASAQSQMLEPPAEVISQGEPFAGLICVLSGEMHVIGTARCGDELLIGVLRQGDWTGFLAALDRGPYAFSVRAKVDCRVARLDKAATDRIFVRDIDRFRLLLSPELGVSRRNYTYFVETAYRPPMLRLAERMMGLGRWPYSAPIDEGARLEQISQADLANATRLSRQTINACLSKMAAQGLVKIGYRSVEVIDPQRLGLVARGELVIE